MGGRGGGRGTHYLGCKDGGRGTHYNGRVGRGMHYHGRGEQASPYCGLLVYMSVPNTLKMVTLVCHKVCHLFFCEGQGGFLLCHAGVCPVPCCAQNLPVPSAPGQQPKVPVSEWTCVCHNVCMVLVAEYVCGTAQHSMLVEYSHRVHITVSHRPFSV